MGSIKYQTMVVGLTGGVASGKTTVASQFEWKGVPVIDTDRISRDLVRSGSEALQEIVREFGDEVLDDQGELDRRSMRLTIFRDEAARRRLENILHPRVGARLDEELRRVEAPYCIVVIPLLVESGWVDRVDRVLVVDAPESAQMERLRARDGLDRDTARSMLESQAKREERLAMADDVLDNSSSPDELGALVTRLHETYLEAAERRRERAGAG